GQQYNSNPLTF
nr:immunoglobulin light chain junction region [Macaca mulatta]MPN82822.1 immunoglobulin light chain junction region [Macaca mulatta]